MPTKKGCTQSKKGRFSREKGKRGERWVANYLTSRGFPARRGVQFSGGKDSPDVVCESLPIHLEVKFVEKLNLKDAYNQAKNDTADKIPVVIHKRNNSPAMVCIDLWDFVDILQLAHDKVDKLNNYIDIRDKYGRDEVRLESGTDLI